MNIREYCEITIQNALATPQYDTFFFLQLALLIFISLRDFLVDYHLFYKPYKKEQNFQSSQRVSGSRVITTTN